MLFTNCEEQSLSSNNTSDSLQVAIDSSNEALPVEYITLAEAQELFPEYFTSQVNFRSDCDEEQECNQGCCHIINALGDFNGDGVVSVVDLSFASNYFNHLGWDSWEDVSYTVTPTSPTWVTNFALLSYIVDGEGATVVTHEDFLNFVRYLLNCYKCD